ncbi:MAG: hypothetical protein ABEH64_13075 [Salinirussus sp.]
MSGEDGALTLAFTLGAFEALADPRAAVRDARRWSQYVGIVDDDETAVQRAAQRAGIQQDYDVGMDRQSTLSRLKWEADTDRYVLVGTDEDDADLADYVNWEFRAIDEAAARAGWRLERNTSTFERLRIRLKYLITRVSSGQDQ